uniref:Uncharacterized protein n=1 Tax=Thermocrispum agreste TaxID=37925 RepID=A0A2W4LX98_9PSEU|nr:MAG: hypothetical protein DIU77_03975 [Thermocrispum agreste]
MTGRRSPPSSTRRTTSCWIARPGRRNDRCGRCLAGGLRGARRAAARPVGDQRPGRGPACRPAGGAAGVSAAHPRSCPARPARRGGRRQPIARAVGVGVVPAGADPAELVVGADRRRRRHRRAGSPARAAGGMG